LKKWRVIFSAFLVFMMILGSQVSASAAYGESYTTAGYQTQFLTNWCWAASSVSILNMKSTSLTPTTQAAHVVRVLGSQINQGRFYTDVAIDLQSYGRSNNIVASYVSYATIVSQVNANKPIYNRVVFWNKTDPYAHAILVTGYRDNGAMQVRIMDPYSGWSYQAYGTYVGSYLGTGNVTGSIYNIS